MPAATTAAPRSSNLRDMMTPWRWSRGLNPGPYPSVARPRTPRSVMAPREGPRGPSAFAAGGARKLGRSGTGGGLVLRAHGVPDLLAVDRNRARRLDADAHRVPDDLHHVDDDLVPQHDLLAGTAGQER